MVAFQASFPGGDDTTLSISAFKMSSLSRVDTCLENQTAIIAAVALQAAAIALIIGAVD